MKIESDKTSALIPRPPNAVEKVEPGAKRVLATMVSETLAMAQKQLTPVSRGPTQAELKEWSLKGWKYHHGQGVPRDYSEAVKWYRKAAEQGDAYAQYDLGECYLNGHGVAQDHAEAVKWYYRAAEKSYAHAQDALGFCCENGVAGPTDYTEAVKWYRKAAEQGYCIAQYHLGLCYEHGRGVKADQIEAYKWFRLAEAQGQKGAAEQVVSVGALLSPKQIAEGERRCKEFKAKHKQT